MAVARRFVLAHQHRDPHGVEDGADAAAVGLRRDAEERVRLPLLRELQGHPEGGGVRGGECGVGMWGHVREWRGTTPA